MLDTKDLEYTKPADDLINIIDVNFTDRGLDTNKHNIYEVACRILRERLGVDPFTEKKGTK